MIIGWAASSTNPAVHPPLREPRWNASAIAAVTALVAFAVVTLSADPWHMAVLLLLAPAFEEAAFRAGLHEGLLRHGVAPAQANFSTAICFVLAHCLLRGFSVTSLAVAGPALLIGWLYGRHRSLRLCIALHIVMNLIWTTAGPSLLSSPSAL